MGKKYELKFDKKFLKKYQRKIDESERKIIDKKILELEENPTKGNPLFNVYPHLYELYVSSYRIYYLVQHNEVRVIILAYEHKNKQKRLLNKIKNDNGFIERILKEIS